MFKYSLENFKQILPSCLVVAVIIIIYGHYRCSNPNFKDPLTGSLFENNKSLSDLFDGWSLSHFFFFMYLGNQYPNTFIEAMTLGILWELTEFWSGQNKPWYLGQCNFSTNEIEGGSWWYGRYSDLFWNCLGFMIGSNKIL